MPPCSIEAERFTCSLVIRRASFTSAKKAPSKSTPSTNAGGFRARGSATRPSRLHPRPTSPSERRSPLRAGVSYRSVARRAHSSIVSFAACRLAASTSSSHRGRVSRPGPTSSFERSDCELELDSARYGETTPRCTSTQGHAVSRVARRRRPGKRYRRRDSVSGMGSSRARQRTRLRKNARL